MFKRKKEEEYTWWYAIYVSMDHERVNFNDVFDLIEKYNLKRVGLKYREVELDEKKYREFNFGLKGTCMNHCLFELDCNGNVALLKLREGEH